MLSAHYPFLLNSDRDRFVGGKHNKLFEEPAIPSGWNKEDMPHNAHRTPDAAPVPEWSRPATAHPSAHRKTQIAQRQSGLVLNSRSNVPGRLQNEA